MEVKFTPWRMAYIGGPKAEGCVLCAAAHSQDDEAVYVVARGRHCFVMLNAYPYNNGHLMVVPYQHTADLLGLAPEVSAELWQLSRVGAGVLGQTMQPAGYNLGMNLGQVAGAGIADHLHMHVVPRWAGDTNFMSVVGETRLIPQSLDDTWTVLRKAWVDAHS